MNVKSKVELEERRPPPLSAALYDEHPFSDHVEIFDEGDTMVDVKAYTLFRVN